MKQLASPHVSLCMIVKDEEKFLPSFLARHQNFFDEWIIVDTGSTDKTPLIIKDAGLQKYHFPWRDDFSAARNYALEQCTCEWIAALDADEFLNLEAQQQMRYFMQKPDIDAYELDIKNYIDETRMMQYCPEYMTEYYPPDGSYSSATNTKQDYGYRLTRLIRFFRNNRGYRWKSPVHEILVAPEHCRHGAISGVTIHHLGMLDLDGKALTKREFYGQLSHHLKKSLDMTNDPKALFEVARNIDNPKDKLEMLLKVWEAAPLDITVLRTVINTQLAVGDAKEAANTCKQMISMDPNTLEGYLLLAKCHAADDHLLEALKVLKEQCRLFHKNALYNYTLATLCLQAQRYHEAKGYSKCAFKLSPKSPMIAKLHHQLHITEN